MRRRLAVVLAMVIIAASSVLSTPPAEAFVRGSWSCTYQRVNGALHPEGRVTCTQAGRTPAAWAHRAKATCWPGVLAFGPWVRPGSTSVARCFFTNVTALTHEIR